MGGEREEKLIWNNENKLVPVSTVRGHGITTFFIIISN